jgi:hypothetical protein
VKSESTALPVIPPPQGPRVDRLSHYGELLDHLILGEAGRFVSLRERGVHPPAGRCQQYAPVQGGGVPADVLMLPTIPG